ncbi:MAG TPA: amidotransferase 1, exosortase A system-associated [Chromatiales bacterium]|nr:amidotransferase 1, exosortase A system-associated [Chromatiales bacterium]
MCGIAGIFDLTGDAQPDEAVLRRMNDIQAHRGPGDAGYYLEGAIGLAHRRLSIIDLSAGRQPISNEDGSVVVTYNGEIYNFQSLRKELEAAGHQFRTHTDTEVIVHAWEQWGSGCVQRFRGMFAFGLWDGNRKRLFLARDRLGIKPLYYAFLPCGSLIFSSELKGLLQHADLPRRLDPLAVEEYFALGYVAEPRTILDGVSKLSPGHVLDVGAGELRATPESYWELAFKPDAQLTEQQAADELIDRLQESVSLRMVADVPVGAFLSGGVDSSAVVALMAGMSDTPVRTCSISFGDPQFNESAFAAMVAQQYGTEHAVRQVDPDDFSLLDRLARIYDEPFADSSALPTFRVCELAREQVKVALSGDGGDENFAGYRRYRWHMFEERFRSALPAGIRQPLFSALATVYPKADWAPRFLRAKTTFAAVALDSIDAYFNSVAISSPDIRRRLFSRRQKADLQGYRAEQVFVRHGEAVDGADALSAVQYLDIKTYLVGDILTKVDRASMANSLEVRVPLLDHEFVEWAATVPSRLKLRGREGKAIFKTAMEDRLPQDILYRQKMGFAVPIVKWLRQDLRDHVRERLMHGALPETGLFDMTCIENLLAQHQAGLRNYGPPLWALLIFESSCRNLLGAGDRVTPVTAMEGL